jgi:hypothetical protein
MKFVAYLAKQNPLLKGQLYKARMPIPVEKFVEKTLYIACMVGFAAAVLVFFFVDKQNYPLWLSPLAGIASGYFAYWYLLKTPILAQAKVANDIDREVLFAGRFLLVKLNSGKPLVNALIEASRSYGVSNKYFLEIVRDIELGTPLEESIEKAMMNSPSKHWRRILFQIHNALKLGIDVSGSLEAVLEDISYSYLIQIQKYGKKLSTITLFYLLMAVVFPSLGMTILTVLLSFTGIALDKPGLFIVILVMLTFVQIIFLRVFLSARPKVNL